MKFKRTLNSINNISSYKNEDITVLNIFDLFHDICQDVKSDSGKAVADFPIGDTGDLVTRLIWLSRMVLRINRENQSHISQLEDKAKRFVDVCNDIEKTSASIEKYESILKDSQKKEQELENNLLELKKLQSQNIQIVENCSQLENEIAKYSDIKIEEVKTKYNDLLNQLEAVKADYNKKLEDFNTLKQQSAQLEADEAEQTKINSDAQQKLLTATQRLNNLKEEYKALTAQTDDSTKECINAENELTQLKTLLLDYTDTKIPLIQSETEQVRADIENVKSSYQQKELEYNSLNDEYVALQQQEESQRAEIAEKELELTDKKEVVSGLKEKHQTLTTEIDTATQECTDIEAQLTQLKAVLVDYTDTKIPAIETETAQVKVDIEAIVNSYQQKESEFNSLKDEYLSLQQQEDAKRAEIANIEIEVASIKDVVAGLEEKYLSVQNEISQLGDEKTSLIENIRTLEKELELNDVEALKAILTSKQQELLSCQQECNQINSEIGEQQKSFDEQLEDLDNKKKIKQDMIWDCEKQISDKNSEIAMLEQQLDACQTERSELIQKASQTQEELLQLKAWFESVEAKSYTDKIKSCTEGVNRMKYSKSMLEKETGLANLLNADTRVSLNELKKYFRDNIDDIEQRLKSYQRSYQIVLNNIDNGGCVI